MKEQLSNLLDKLNKLIIIVLFFLSLLNIITPFLLFHRVKNVQILHYLEIHHTIGRLLSFVILIIAWKLYKRVSAAWNIAMAALLLLLFQYTATRHFKLADTLHVVFLIELLIFIILLFSKNYYCRKMDKYSLKRGIYIYLCFIGFLFLNAMIGLFNLRRMYASNVPFISFAKQALDDMLDTGNLNMLFYSQSITYHKFVFWFSWICIIVGLLLVLTPYIALKSQSQQKIERVRKIVLKYGQNCNSYLTLEQDKLLFLGKDVEGYIAYGIVRDTIVVLGDPICAPSDFIILLSEFKSFCIKNAYSLIFLNTTRMFLKEYEKLGFGCVKCGEEPRININEYSLAGKKASKVRLNINHATKTGLTVKEYEPLKEKDLTLEKKIMEVSQEWLTMKKSSELIFTMGSIGFENPMERRYFYALNKENEVEGFIVFVPFAGMKGYMADVTRQCRNAVRGVMEKILYESILKFKEEGVEWVSLAVAPLARLEDEPEVAARFLNIIYEKMNSVYGFKSLYQTKLKYNPTIWEPSYYTYYPPIFTPNLAFAIVRVQNSQGMLDYIKAFFRNR